jgi:bifunctional ADP-heptose synthase (sugar kinase/adenylyltransferase)
LDTRSKIISAEEAHLRLGDKPAQWVTGHFDPLLAEHVRWLRECSARDQLLVVAITNPARPLLAQRARAELAAALAMVDYVVMKNDAAPEASGDAAITGRFIHRVLRRNGRAGAG